MKATPTLRVLLLNERCHANPLAGGAETHLFEIFGRLAEQGVETTLLCCGFDGAPEHDEHRGVRIRRLGRRLSYYAKLPSVVRSLASRSDVAVEALNKVPFLTPLYAGLPTLAIHHHLHGLTAFRQVGPVLAAGSWLLEQLIPLVYRKAPLLTISHSSKRELTGRGLPEQHIDVVPCGIDHELHQPALVEGREPLIVSLGRLEPYKRIDLALRAFALVHRERPDARFAIVGRGQEEARLRRLSRTLGVEDAVQFCGFLSEPDKVSLLQRASLLVQCSRKEGWGLTVIEANACGVPVVATDVPGLSDSVRDGITGVLVQKPKPAVVAAALGRLLDDEPRRLTMARRGLEEAQRYRWEESAQAVLTALRRLSGAHRPAPAPRRPTAHTVLEPRRSSMAAARAHEAHKSTLRLPSRGSVSASSGL